MKSCFGIPHHFAIGVLNDNGIQGDTYANYFAQLRAELAGTSAMFNFHPEHVGAKHLSEKKVWDGERL
ncbi:MAG: hypothetical protein OSB67_06865 [Alphaproteobacteria bacterium]|nr:hypothetical protein [Alphaproteobacteria bacterium]